MSTRSFRQMEHSRSLPALLITALVALLALPHILPTYYLGIVIEMIIFSLFAMSLDLLVGFTGMASLGHAAYFGIAAYAAGLLALKLSWSVWLAMPAALIITAMTATAFGLLALRTRGSYFLMITLALSQVAWGIAFGWRSLTGGDDGLPNIPRPSLTPNWPLTDDTTFYYFVLVLASLGTFLLLRITSSPFGYALRGIRESETRMLALGYNVRRYKLTVFIVAATMAGLAGCLYVYYNRFVSPDYLQVIRSAEVLLMVILGGAGTLIGPAIGASLLVALENLISAYTERWLMVLGVIYILVALLAPRGIMGVVRDLRSMRAKR
jgi:branched-chain amino acid transport system permease protein